MHICWRIEACRAFDRSNVAVCGRLESMLEFQAAGDQAPCSAAPWTFEKTSAGTTHSFRAWFFSAASYTFVGIIRPPIRMRWMVGDSSEVVTDILTSILIKLLYQTLAFFYVFYRGMVVRRHWTSLSAWRRTNDWLIEIVAFLFTTAFIALRISFSRSGLTNNKFSSVICV